MLCSVHLLAAIGAIAAWLLILTLVDVLTSSSTWLHEPAIAAPSLVLVFLAFEARLLLRGARASSNPRVEMAISLLVLHAAAIWYAVLRLALAQPDRRGLEALHAALLYAMLLALVYLRWRLGGGLPERLAELEVELSEARVQYDAVCALLQRRSHLDAEDESDFEGDEREHLIVPPAAVIVPAALKGRPEKVMPHALAGHEFDRSRAVKIARRIRLKTYTLAAYYDDVRAAFPELHLYLAQAEGDGLDEASNKPAVTSGLGADDEYRRTIGALFAVYWLMRIGIDGERGFSFGVDEEWSPHEVPVLDEVKSEYSKMPKSHKAASVSGDEAKPTLKEPAKRIGFYEKQDWQRLQQLLIDSGMLERDPSEIGGVRVVIERTVAMLALTAFHDAMKLQALLPAVAAEHAPYEGFKANDVINDHDIALGYVLDHYPDVIPSFAAATPDNQRSIRFTQSKMGFNHGWLVQGEAPPAPLFKKFKDVMNSEGVSPADVAFYFVHWLTDLAGAEPSPLGGAEKFVLKFPHAVLDSFIRSFAVLNELAVKTETAVMEDYLVRTWGEVNGAGFGPAPSNEDGIALMRLALQAQTPDKQSAILQAYRALPGEDASVLRDEMARTGLSGQLFKAAPAFKQSSGPAILVYYSPAFVRSLAPHHALEALRVLAEVYRRARQMWPLGRSDSGAAESVTIRIDQIKELKLTEIQGVFTQGESWLLCRKNDVEAVVERHSLDYMSQQSSQLQAAVLKFWRLEKDAGSRQSKKSSNVRSQGSHTPKSVGFVGSNPSVKGSESPLSQAAGGAEPPPAKILEQQLQANVSPAQGRPG
jgi:hypothetical protein